MINLPKEAISQLIKNRGKPLDYVAVLIFFIFTLLAIRYQIRLLSYIEWGDESETIVASKMLAAGGSLYSQIFNHHGPLTFLPGVILEKLGDFGIVGHRVSIAMLQIVALLSIYFSPILNNGLARKLYTMAAGSVMLLCLPEIFGHTYMYQVLAGLFLVIILAQYSIPVIACQDNVSTRNVVIGNILIASLPFLAITYAPVSLLLFFASLKKDFIKNSLIAFVGACFANVGFLLYIGSIPGYFAFHIYLNSKILPYYNGGKSGMRLIQNAFGTITVDLSQFAILMAFVAAISRLASCEKVIPWRSISIAIGIGSLLIRGGGFHGLPYFYSLLAIPLIFFLDRPIATSNAKFIALMFSLVCVIKLSLAIPGDEQKFESRKIPDSTEFSQLAKIFTEKNDRIIAYSFQNLQYILADRLPASGHFFYLPWQEKYNENPKFGISINACREISEYRPKIMLIDKWNVWDRFSWDSYASCIQNLIDREYIKLPERPYYVRKDLVSDEMGLTSSDITTKMQPSTQLGASAPVPVLMTSGHKNQRAGLKRIGVMFGTYVRKNLGDAELRLKGQDGVQFSQRFSLSELEDNKYRYFDVDSKRYSSGEILSITGGGVSTWESHSDKGDVNTCMTYEYNNGKKSFTPGCPLFTQ